MLITLRGQEGGGGRFIRGGRGVGVRRRFVGRGFFVRARVQLLPELIIRANPGCQFVLSVNKERSWYPCTWSHCSPTSPSRVMEKPHDEN